MVPQAQTTLVRSLKSWFYIPLSLFLGLAGCAKKQEHPPLVVASYGSIDTIDPAQATTSSAMQLIAALGDPSMASMPVGRSNRGWQQPCLN
ncbi:hypothetical protein AAF134_07145 [Synechococcus lacustris Tous-12m]